MLPTQGQTYMTYVFGGRSYPIVDQHTNTKIAGTATAVIEDGNFTSKTSNKHKFILLKIYISKIYLDKI